MKKNEPPNFNHVLTYLSFELNNEIFAVNVENVINILEMKKITSIPKSPEYFKGIINLRGKALPVVDLRIIFGINNLKFTNDTCILVLQIKVEGEEILLGAIVDCVKEVLELEQNYIEPVPSIGTKYHPDFINGIWKMDERFIMLLDLDNVINPKDILIVQNAS
ncbi:MAG: hypothetical protein A2041_00520 [Bacteroidetes bacterium GWA2_31_9b]|nr:MAG: hypothetical protein A2041_00520 [Bacteroidetes bacterium GWA2_31_9b]